MRLLILLAWTGCGSDAGFSVQDTPPPPPVGEALIEPLELDLVDAIFDTPRVGEVRIENIGTHPLRLRSGTVHGGDGILLTNTESNSDRRIEEGEHFDLLIVCRYRERPMEPVEATLIVQTNDPQAAQVEIPISCTPSAHDEGTDSGEGQGSTHETDESTDPP
ncbi:MAG: hypothetical protein EA397_12530 [Deltaproteobacteria bacterium]|nr:MAG: hypothetical protein EA397_12530 [Deltaproteobacteria bacterium]